MHTDQGVDVDILTARREGSPEAVREILDKQSAVTSSRLPMPVLSDLVSGGMRFLLMPYNASWRKLRGIVHQLLAPRMSGVFAPSQEFEAKQLMFECLTDNKTDMDFYQHVRRYAASVVMASTYGRRIPKWVRSTTLPFEESTVLTTEQQDCDDIREIYGLMEEFSISATPGYFLADTFPPLAKLPVFLQPWRRQAAVYFERQAKIWMRYWSTLSSQIAAGNAPACFVKQFKETGYESLNISELQAAFLAGTMIEAGSETTSATLNIALLHLAAFPQKARAAQKEIDRVVGSERCPSFADEDQLPYIRAIVKEILSVRPYLVCSPPPCTPADPRLASRMFPTTTFGVPHYTDDDVKYKDMIIPKGTVVVMNQQKLHFDPSRWEDPFEFRPERYLSYPLKASAYAAMADASKRDHFSFGAGTFSFTFFSFFFPSFFLVGICPPRTDYRHRPKGLPWDASRRKLAFHHAGESVVGVRHFAAAGRERKGGPRGHERGCVSSWLRHPGEAVQAAFWGEEPRDRDHA